MAEAHLVYEFVLGFLLGSSTIAQIERSPAGIAAWAKCASVIESYNDQKLMGLLKDCQSLDFAQHMGKADANCQKLLKHTGGQGHHRGALRLSIGDATISIFARSVAYFESSVM